MRCWQAEQIGFRRVIDSDLVKALMGEPYTETIDLSLDEKNKKLRQVYEYTYNHHEDKVLEQGHNWGGWPSVFICKRRLRDWFLSPFDKREIWRCEYGKLNYLKRQISDEAVSYMNKVKSLRLFNVFNVLAPQDAWENKDSIVPYILLSSIWEWPPVDKDKTGTAGQIANYFIGLW
jgi:hypothetical protein